MRYTQHMPRFKYKAVGANGRIQHGELEAPSQAAAIQNLQNTGNLPISATEVSPRSQFYQSLSRLFRRHNTVSWKDTVTFMGELATLLQAGLPVDHALKTMEDITSSLPLKNVIHIILERIRGGANLSEALAENNNVFDALQVNMIRAGEASGALYSVIDRLATYMERMDELRSSVITALIYPIILLVMAGLSLFVLMTFVVPKFIPLFADMGHALPLLTQIVFDFAAFFQKTWWVILCLIVILAWYADGQLEDPNKRKRFDAWCLHLPYLGELFKEMETARFTRTLGTLISNGVPLLTAVELVKDVIGNRELAAVMPSVTVSLEQGQSLARPLRDSHLFPALSVQLIEVGEESGNLDEMLIKVAEIYDRQVQTSLKRMLTLLEPVLILGLGALIGVIIISILMAMLGLNDLVV